MERYFVIRRLTVMVFADFLFVNSRFEKSSTEKDKYGYLERENGVYYFKLNFENRSVEEIGQ